ncbi:NAD(P)/FAD-dependent oxidoreductase [Nocardioides sp.]|uniref:protoporphyrinogen/coproporphyrinogen oxidase n=1 Tax=Nocardioides sp. TaxID=35761 RepID=UPI0035185A42
MQRRTIVVGGGVAGLAAARELTAAGDDVVVLEADAVAGGKLRTEAVADVVVDVGAEAVLARRPEGVALIDALGLPRVHPTAATSRVWTRGALRPLPRTLMGAPLDTESLAASGILSAAGLARASAPVLGMPAGIDPEDPDADISVGHLVAHRFGDEVVDRLVEPLLGGVYAGQARAISTRAAVPQLWAGLPPAAPTLTGPVFASVAGGMGRIPATLAAGLVVRTGVEVTALHRDDDGFVLATSAGTERADAVVLATPAGPSARLLAGLAPGAAAELGAVAAASVVVVTLAFRAADLPAGLDDASGLLCPPVDGHGIKASTFSFAKWDWVREAGLAAGGVVHLRTSLGRAGEPGVLDRDDADLVALSLADLAAATGLSARPVASHVQRWPDGLPQYAVGHRTRVARLRADVARVPGLAVCGAVYDGVGIAACLASASAAFSTLGPAPASR